MALALAGAIFSLLVLGKIHDTFLKNIKGQRTDQIPISLETSKSSEST